MGEITESAIFLHPSVKIPTNPASWPAFVAWLFEGWPHLDELRFRFQALPWGKQSAQLDPTLLGSPCHIELQSRYGVARSLVTVNAQAGFEIIAHLAELSPPSVLGSLGDVPTVQLKNMVVLGQEFTVSWNNPVHHCFTLRQRTSSRSRPTLAELCLPKRIEKDLVRLTRAGKPGFFVVFHETHASTNQSHLVFALDHHHPFGSHRKEYVSGCAFSLLGALANPNPKKKSITSVPELQSKIKLWSAENLFGLVAFDVGTGFAHDKKSNAQRAKTIMQDALDWGANEQTKKQSSLLTGCATPHSVPLLCTCAKSGVSNQSGCSECLGFGILQECLVFDIWQVCDQKLIQIHYAQDQVFDLINRGVVDPKYSMGEYDGTN